MHHHHTPPATQWILSSLNKLSSQTQVSARVLPNILSAAILQTNPLTFYGTDSNEAQFAKCSATINIGIRYVAKFWWSCNLILASQMQFSFCVDAHFKQQLVCLRKHRCVTDYSVCLVIYTQEILLSWERRYHCTSIFFPVLTTCVSENRFCRQKASNDTGSCHQGTDVRGLPSGVGSERHQACNKSLPVILKGSLSNNSTNHINGQEANRGSYENCS